MQYSRHVGEKEVFVHVLAMQLQYSAQLVPVELDVAVASGTARFLPHFLEALPRRYRSGTAVGIERCDAIDAATVETEASARWATRARRAIPRAVRSAVGDSPSLRPGMRHRARGADVVGGARRSRAAVHESGNA